MNPVKIVRPLYHNCLEDKIDEIHVINIIIDYCNDIEEHLDRTKLLRQDINDIKHSEFDYVSSFNYNLSSFNKKHAVMVSIPNMKQKCYRSNMIVTGYELNFDHNYQPNSFISRKEWIRKVRIIFNYDQDMDENFHNKRTISVFANINKFQGKVMTKYKTKSILSRIKLIL